MDGLLDLLAGEQRVGVVEAIALCRGARGREGGALRTARHLLIG